MFRPTLLLLLLATSSLPLEARDLEWKVVSGWSFEQEIARLAESGFAVEALVTHAPEPMALLARPCCRRTDPVATYRVVGRSNAGAVADLGELGFVLRSFATDRLGGATAVFEHRPSSSAPKVEYRSVVGDLATLGPELETLGAEGFRAVAAAGKTLSAPDWVLLARDSQSSPREIRVIDTDSPRALESELDAAAGSGFAVDTAWSRTTKKFSLMGPERLAALASRPPGDSRPVAQVRVTVASEPDSGSGALVATMVSRSHIAFVQRDGRSSSPWVREVPWQEPGSAGSWDRWSAIEEQLRRYQSRSLGHSWLVWDAGVPSRLFVRDREEVTTEPARSTAAVPTLTIPEGTITLDASAAPWTAYLEILAGIRKRDLEGTKKRWGGDVAAAWANRVETFKAPFGLGFSEKSLFKSLADELPTDPVFLGGWLLGENATVRVEGTINGQRKWSDLGLALEAGQWKLMTQSAWYEL